MSDDKTQSETQKPCILSFPFRKTGMGGIDDTAIISLRTGKIIGSVLHTSRTGNHGTRLYKVLPAKYVMYSVSRSNGGHIHAKIAVIRVDDECSVSPMNEWRMDTVKGEVLMLSDIPNEIRKILMSNRDGLPLFNHIFPFDNDNQEGE